MSAQISHFKYEEPASPTDTKVVSASKLDEECAIEDGDKASPVMGAQHRKLSMNDPLPMDLKQPYMPLEPIEDKPRRKGSESWNKTVHADIGSRLALLRRND